MPKQPLTSKGVEGEQKRIMRRGERTTYGTRGTPSDDVLAEQEEEEARQARTFFAKEPEFLATWQVASGEDDNRSGSTTPSWTPCGFVAGQSTRDSMGGAAALYGFVNRRWPFVNLMDKKHPWRVREDCVVS
ncbi:unnamed protein product [Amoebophrya sp. A120]|nr:unnamed protein product [Amoebophrya sp. A120]|eukprot:GSA120T00020600001.1